MEKVRVCVEEELKLKRIREVCVSENNDVVKIKARYKCQEGKGTDIHCKLVKNKGNGECGNEKWRKKRDGMLESDR